MRCKRVSAAIAISTCVFLAFVTAGCEKKSADTVRIGVITSLTGSQSAFGEAHKNAYLIALDEINTQGGVLGKKLELDFYDDQGKPDRAVVGVSKLADQDGAIMLLGAFSSQTTKAILPSVTQRQIPLIIPSATADNLMDSGSPWIFRLSGGSADYARAVIAFLQDNGAPKTMAIVYENTDYGQEMMNAMSRAAQDAAIKLVAVESYEARSPDYKALLHHVKQSNPDVIYFCSYLLDANTLMRQAQEIDLNPRYYIAAGGGFVHPDFPTGRGAGKNAEFTFSVSQWRPQAQWTGAREFDAEYVQRHGSHAAEQAMTAYAALRIAAQAIRDAKALDRTRIRDAIAAMNLSMTPFGPVKFDPVGRNQHPLLITQVQGGEYRVVYPPNVADAKPVIPAPPWAKR